tara:strand:- start:714 stop:1238 length:525 start_codon:yes stop_codon:yes gene_type:complete
MRILLPILTLLIFSCNDIEDNKIDTKGCIYEIALNYNENATIDNGSCIFDEEKYPIPNRRPKEILSKVVLMLYGLFSMGFSIILTTIIIFNALSFKNPLIRKLFDKIEDFKMFRYIYWAVMLISWFYLFKLILGAFYSIPKIYNSVLYDSPNSFIITSADYFISFINLIISFFK